MTTATYTALTAEQRKFYEMNMLKRAVPPFVHLYFGQEGSVFPVTSLPENKGHQVQWNKLASLTATTTALTEGSVPDPEDISITSVTGTVSEYGAYVKYTRTLAQFGIHKVAAEASDALGEQAGDSLDLITRAALVAETSNVQFANSRADTDSITATDYLTFTEIMKAVTTLKSNKAQGPMNGKFVCLLHPNAVYDLFSDTTFQSVLNYSQDRGANNPWSQGYIGEAFGVVFYETPNAYHADNAAGTPVDVYSTIILGKGAYGVGGLAAYMPKIVKEQNGNAAQNHTFEKVSPIKLIHKPFGSAGSADPFDSFATIAWYTTFVPKVLDANFYVRIEHATRLG